MSVKSLVCDVESIALALSEHDGYEYYHIDDDLKELAKNVRDMQAENAKLRELIGILAFCTNDEAHDCDKCAINGAEMHVTVPEWLFCDSLIERLRTLGFEVTE